MGSKQKIKFTALIVGIALVLFPEPVTTATGLVLIAVSLGVD